MPHLTLHYSANVDGPHDFGRLFDELHRTLAGLTGVDIGKFKSRALRCEEFRVGDGSPAGAFAHLALRLLGGRSAEDRGRCADAALAVLGAHFGGAGPGGLQITVDLLDLDPDTYRKAVTRGEAP